MNYITFDIETTGLDIYKDTPIQMAYTVHDSNDKLLTEKSFYIYNGKKLNPIITQITGITDDVLLDHGVSPNAGVVMWQTALRAFQPLTLVGYNIVNFDFPMVQNWINNNSSERFKSPAVCALIDVMILIAAIKKSKWMKLIKAAEAYNISFKAEELHDALADVRVTWELYKKIR